MNFAYPQSDVEVSGIVFGKDDESVAVVNREMIKAGDKVGGIEIAAIDGESVIFKQNGKEWVERIGENVPATGIPGTDVAPAQAPASVIAGLYGAQGAIAAEEVASFSLSLFYDAGAIEGYVIFRDRKGEMRAVNFIEPAYVDVQEPLYVERGRAHYAKENTHYRQNQGGCMLTKKFALGFGIAVIFPMMIHYGAATFMPEPRWQDYHRMDEQMQMNRQSMSQAERQQAAAKRQKHEDAWRYDQKRFQRALFSVAAPLGIMAIIVGSLITVQAVGTGLMFGGIFSVLDGYCNYWSELPNGARFASLLLAFIVLVYIGWRKLAK